MATQIHGLFQVGGVWAPERWALVFFSLLRLDSNLALITVTEQALQGSEAKKKKKARWEKTLPGARWLAPN